MDVGLGIQRVALKTRRGAPLKSLTRQVGNTSSAAASVATGPAGNTANSTLRKYRAANGNGREPRR